MSVQIIDFTAYRNDLPGPDKDEAELLVRAILRFNTGGWRRGQVKVIIGINPAMLVLEVVVTKPSGPATEALDDQLVTWAGPAGLITEVHLRVVGDAEDSATIDVTPAS